MTTTVACTNINLLAESQMPANPSQTELYAVEIGKPLSQFNTSNCVTYIPQDINLTLVNGVLTLKAGSKVYIPNGVSGSTKTFTTVTIASNITKQQTGSVSDADLLLYYNQANNSLGISVLTNSNSGAGATTTSGIAYDTTTNRISSYNSSGTVDQSGSISLPIALIKRVSSTFTKIKQCFNGFGCIGKTLFVLPGVKGLIPNGRNSDGSLKSIEFVTDSVRVSSTILASAITAYIAVNDTMINPAQKIITDYEEGINYIYDQYTSSYANWAALGSVTFDSNGKVSDISVPTIFHALDYTDKSEITKFIMPNYAAKIAISSGYVAEANGYVTANAAGFCNLFLYVNGTRVGGTYTDHNGSSSGFVVVAAGDTITFEGSTVTTYFIPCFGG